jgi:hypothetical protein
MGSVKSNSKFIHTVSSSTNSFSVDSTMDNIGKSFKRTYIGGDIQIIYDIPSLGGVSIRGEYIFGEQPGTLSSNSFYNPSSANTPLYRRNFYGYYITLLQNVGSQHQVIVRYDVLDPNSKLADSEIGYPGVLTTVGDIQFATIGFGYLFHYDENVKFTFYYEMPSNEKVHSNSAGALSAYREDVNDDVFTFRIQYRFPF